MTISEETLRAYVDGELPPDEHARVQALLETDDLARERASLMELSGEYLASARDSLYDDTMDTDALAKSIMDGTLTEPAPEPQTTLPPQPANAATNMGRRYFFRPAIAASFAAVFFGMGGVVGMQAGNWFGEEEMPGWIVRVADYQTLYARDTVQKVHMTDAERTAFIAEAEMRMGQAITIPDLSAEGLEFRRAQFLFYDGKPVIQMVYLPLGSGEPIALCLIKTAKGDAGPKSRAHRNLNLVSWRKGGIAFLLAADTPDAKLKSVAQASGA